MGRTPDGDAPALGRPRGGDGEWQRYELRDDAYLRELARQRGLTIHDAMRVGYPERMRTYKRPERP